MDLIFRTTAISFRLSCPQLEYYKYNDRAHNEKFQLEITSSPPSSHNRITSPSPITRTWPEFETNEVSGWTKTRPVIWIVLFVRESTRFWAYLHEIDIYYFALARNTAGQSTASTYDSIWSSPFLFCSGDGLHINNALSLLLGFVPNSGRDWRLATPNYILHYSE